MDGRATNEGTCLRCGTATDERVNGDFLCDACYILRGSCCPEFGPDDLCEGAVEAASTVAARAYQEIT